MLEKLLQDVLEPYLVVIGQSTLSNSDRLLIEAASRVLPGLAGYLPLPDSSCGPSGNAMQVEAVSRALMTVVAAYLVGTQQPSIDKVVLGEHLTSQSLAEAIRLIRVSVPDGPRLCLTFLDRLMWVDRRFARQYALLLHRENKFDYWPAHFYVSAIPASQPNARYRGLRWLLASFPQHVGMVAKIMADAETAMPIPADIVMAFNAATANPDARVADEWGGHAIAGAYERLAETLKAYRTLESGYRLEFSNHTRYEYLTAMARLAGPLFSGLAELRLLVTALRVMPGHTSRQATITRAADLVAALPNIRCTQDKNEFIAGTAGLFQSDGQYDIATWLQVWLQIPMFLTPPERAEVKKPPASHSQVVIPAEEIAMYKLPDPDTIAYGQDPLAACYDLPIFTHRRREVKITTLSNAFLRISGLENQVFNESGDVLLDYSSGHASFFRLDPVKMQAATSLIGSYFSICVPYGHSNYSHFLLDRIPQLAFCRGWLSDAKLLVDEDALEWTAQLLRTVGSKASLTPIRMNCLYHLEEVTVLSKPQHPSQMGFHGYVEFLNDILRLANRNANCGKRILIHRKKGRRGIDNQEEFYGCMQEYGFQVVALEDFEICDQLEIMHQSEIVVSVHGAGLSNIIVCRPGTKVIEILPPAYFIATFAIISRAANLRYRAYLEVSEINAQIAQRQQFSDTFIELKWWRPFLERVLAS